MTLNCTVVRFPRFRRAVSAGSEAAVTTRPRDTTPICVTQGRERAWDSWLYSVFFGISLRPRVRPVNRCRLELTASFCVFIPICELHLSRADVILLGANGH